jgi:hypothetical protein
VATLGKQGEFAERLCLPRFARKDAVGNCVRDCSVKPTAVRWHVVGRGEDSQRKARAKGNAIIMMHKAT